MIADHAPILVRHMAPDWQGVMNALLIVFQHRLGDVRIYLPVDDVEERMEGAIRVPYGEDRVIGETFRLMDIMVQAAILPVHVRINTGVDHRVIQ